MSPGPYTFVEKEGQIARGPFGDESSGFARRMVVLSVKRSEVDQFIYECSIVDSADAVTRAVVS